MAVEIQKKLMFAGLVCFFKQVVHFPVWSIPYLLLEDSITLLSLSLLLFLLIQICISNCMRFQLSDAGAGVVFGRKLDRPRLSPSAVADGHLRVH